MNQLLAAVGEALATERRNFLEHFQHIVKCRVYSNSAHLTSRTQVALILENQHSTFDT